MQKHKKESTLPSERLEQVLRQSVMYSSIIYFIQFCYFSMPFGFFLLLFTIFKFTINNFFVFCVLFIKILSLYKARSISYRCQLAEMKVEPPKFT